MAADRTSVERARVRFTATGPRADLLSSPPMGLSITVGMLRSVAGDAEGVAYFRDAFDALAAALARAGHPGWREPDVARPRRRPAIDSFPYSFLHYLRRAYALVLRGRPVTPVAGRLTEADEELILDETSMLSSHLLCHSDTAGYYVPLALGDPLFLDEGERVAGGGMVGSSRALLAELRQVAPAIGVRLEPDGSLSDAEARRLYDTADDHPFSREQTVWLTLHEACVDSLATGAAIVFH